MIVKTGRQLIADYTFGDIRKAPKYHLWLMPDPINTEKLFVEAEDTFESLYGNEDGNDKYINMDVILKPEALKFPLKSTNSNTYLYTGESVYKGEIALIETKTQTLSNKIKIVVKDENDADKDIEVPLYFVPNPSFDGDVLSYHTKEIDLGDHEKAVVQAYQGDKALHLLLVESNEQTTVNVKTLVLRHSPQEYFYDIDTLLNKEVEFNYIAAGSIINGVKYYENVETTTKITIVNKNMELMPGTIFDDTAISDIYTIKFNSTTRSSDNAASQDNTTASLLTMFSKIITKETKNGDDWYKLDESAINGSGMYILKSANSLLKNHLYQINENGNIVLAKNSAYLDYNKSKLVGNIIIQVHNNTDATSAYTITNVILTYKYEDAAEGDKDILFSREIIPPFIARSGHDIYSKLEIQL